MLFQFKVQIKGITKPPVWRKVSIPDNFTFLDFHYIIQIAFGWENTHLFEFRDQEYQSNIRIGIPYDDFFDPDFAAQTKDASHIGLSAVFNEAGQKLLYVYDFGDSWVHEITLESVTDGKQKAAVCLSGKGACPPEDCGGVWGYEDIKHIFETAPGSKQANDCRKWLGLKKKDIWDAKFFNIDDVNTILKKIPVNK
ncbi:plasmid pRiA4b ORF-3 family protein [Dysgonomonas sp.]